MRYVMIIIMLVMFAVTPMILSAEECGTSAQDIWDIQAMHDKDHQAILGILEFITDTMPDCSEHEKAIFDLEQAVFGQNSDKRKIKSMEIQIEQLRSELNWLEARVMQLEMKLKDKL